ncbi:MAG: TRCF domain-containing protein [Patescibacteria group bacterium]|nr:TRCF domain-containing protein [Patescibacteria group bacterium]
MPETYISQTQEKIRIYQKLSTCKTLKDIQNTQSEIEEVYGAIPAEMQDIFMVLTLRYYLKKQGFISIRIYEKNIREPWIEL